MCMNMHIHRFTCMYIYTDVHIYRYTYRQTSIHIYICRHMYMSTDIYIYIHMYEQYVHTCRYETREPKKGTESSRSSSPVSPLGASKRCSLSSERLAWSSRSRSCTCRRAMTQRASGQDRLIPNSASYFMELYIYIYIHI